MTTRRLIGMVYNSSLASAAGLVDGLVESLELGQAAWTCPATEIGEMSDKLGDTSLVVVAGGDGTILRIIRTVAPHGVPIVGINMGRVGFMAELRVDEAAKKLSDYVDGGMRVEERMMLEAVVRSRPDETPRLRVHALNDVVVGRGGIARLLDIETTVDGVELTSYRADAVIVSTATGSTGYALSAGGPIIQPETRVMLIHPVAAHTGLRSGLILPDTSVIELQASDSQEAVLSVDGFPDTSLQSDDVVTIKPSPHVARFLRADSPSTFYAALTRRLGLEPSPGPAAPPPTGL